MKPKGTANIMHVNKRVITVKFQIKYTLLRVYDPYLTKYCINPGRLALFRLFFVEILSIIAFTKASMFKIQRGRARNKHAKPHGHS